jgi:hypothetical protein
MGSMVESPKERKFASMGLTGLPSASSSWLEAMSFEAISCCVLGRSKQRIRASAYHVPKGIDKFEFLGDRRSIWYI